MLVGPLDPRFSGVQRWWNRGWYAWMLIVSNITLVTSKITRLLVTLLKNSSKPRYSLLTLTWIEKNDDYSLLL